MSFIKCFDVVSMVVEEATNKFAPTWRLNKGDYKILEQYCSAIDSLAEECGGKSFDVFIDVDTKTVKVVMECVDMTIESIDHKFYALAQRSKPLSFSVSESGDLNIEFTFPSVWIAD